MGVIILCQESERPGASSDCGRPGILDALIFMMGKKFWMAGNVETSPPPAERFDDFNRFSSFYVAFWPLSPVSSFSVRLACHKSAFLSSRKKNLPWLVFF
jgi:hypothetical protein